MGGSSISLHNSWFLDRTCTHFIAFEGESIAKMYVGNWPGYEEMTVEKFGGDLQLQRVKVQQWQRQYVFTKQRNRPKGRFLC
jgi:ATPase subunit of ABC transporter with duplicated ATPase domains